MNKLDKIITHKNLEKHLRMLEDEPYFKPGPQSAPVPKWVYRAVTLEVPLGELAKDGLTTLALTSGRKPTLAPITGKEKFNAQGIEGKAQIRTSFFNALISMRDILPPYRGRIVID